MTEGLAGNAKPQRPGRSRSLYYRGTGTGTIGTGTTGGPTGLTGVTIQPPVSPTSTRHIRIFLIIFMFPFPCASH